LPTQQVRVIATSSGVGAN